MEYREIKGARMPALGFGTWQLTGRNCFAAVRQALALGYRHIDTAQLYGNESEVGRAVAESGLRRDEVFLTTKLAPGNLAPGLVQRSAEDSLRRLGTDHVDLLLIHWPGSEILLGDTLSAMTALRKAGKTRFIGVSNFTVKLLAQSVETEAADLLCDQVEYHPFLSQGPVMAALARYGMVLTAYAPLARGHVERDKAIAAIARKHGKSPAQIALRWLLDQPGVAAIPKAASAAHASANLDIFDFKLAAEDRAVIDRLRGSRRLVDPAGWSPSWDPP